MKKDKFTSDMQDSATRMFGFLRKEAKVLKPAFKEHSDKVLSQARTVFEEAYKSFEDFLKEREGKEKKKESTTKDPAIEEEFNNLVLSAKSVVQAKMLHAFNLGGRAYRSTGD